jgi:hypothetical protein
MDRTLGRVQQVSNLNGGTYPGRPWRFSRKQYESRCNPAFLGQRNRALFGELGLSQVEINSYTASGALVVASSTVASSN